MGSIIDGYVAKMTPALIYRVPHKKRPVIWHAFL